MVSCGGIWRSCFQFIHSQALQRGAFGPPAPSRVRSYVHLLGRQAARLVFSLLFSLVSVTRKGLPTTQSTGRLAVVDLALWCCPAWYDCGSVFFFCPGRVNQSPCQTMSPSPGRWNNLVVGAALHERPPRFQRLLRVAGGDDRRRRGESPRGSDCPAGPRVSGLSYFRAFVVYITFPRRNGFISNVWNNRRHAFDFWRTESVLQPTRPNKSMMLTKPLSQSLTSIHSATRSTILLMNLL